jgi:hypothetical protein
MIKIGQFSTPQNSGLVMAAKVGLHLKNQKTETLLNLQKRFCSSSNPEVRVVFTEGILVLFSLGRIEFDAETDRVLYREDH